MTAQTTAATPPREGRWLMLGLLFACRAAMGLQFQTLGSVSNALIGDFGLSYSEIGTLIGLFMAPGLLLAIPAGYAGRHASDRALSAAGLVCMAAGGVIAVLADGFAALALSRVLSGLGFVLCTLYFTKMAADWFAGRELATAMGILVMSWPFGIAVAQLGQVWVAAHFGWRVAFGVAAAYGALSAVAIGTLYRVPAGVHRVSVGGASGLPRAELRLTLLAAAVWGLFNAGYIVYLSFAPRVLVDGGYESAAAMAVISVASWVMIFSGAACGQLADRTGRRDLILYVCTAIGVVSLLCLPQVGWALVLSLAFGLFGMAPAGIIMALTGESMAPQRRAFGMGVFMTFYFVLVTLAPPLAGWLFDRSGDAYGPVLLAAGLFTAAASVNALFRSVKTRQAAA